MYHFVCVKGATFWCVFVGGLRWLDMKDHVHNYVPCHLKNVNGQIDQFLAIVHVGNFIVCYVGNLWELLLC
jgi:hypothetical protein